MVFAVGFAVGTVRVLLVEPRLGPAPSVAAEIPLMLLVSWFAARSVAGYFDVSKEVVPRLAMGVIAVVLLVSAETALGLAFGQSLGQQFSAYGSARGVLTLAGQAGFALMPVLAAGR